MGRETASLQSGFVDFWGRLIATRGGSTMQVRVPELARRIFRRRAVRDTSVFVRFPASALAEQAAAVLRAWGMSEEHVGITTAMMLYADLRGIDSHGIGMLPTYRLWRSRGWIRMPAHPRIERDSATTALVDGDRCLGHVPAHMAMRLAVDKCRKTGLSAVAVRNSSHFGAAGAYAALAVEQDLIGLVTTSAPSRAIVPTFGIEPMFGTNPLAFAAPAGRNPPFFLDMATSTVAIGKLTLALRGGVPIPSGWALDEHGKPVTDARTASRLHLMTPLGGGPKTSGYKGYGLAAMVEVLSNILSGNGYRDNEARRDSTRPNTVSHFFLALDPAMFRGIAAFHEDLDGMIDALHACTPQDPRQPVLVAGDPERRTYADRSVNGVPLSKALRDKLAEVARDAGAPFFLD